MIEGLQTFRNEDGFIICVKMGWIAVDVWADAKFTTAECVGYSTNHDSGKPLSYYDIALNGEVKLHILHWTFGESLPAAFMPYYIDIYPF